MAISSLLRFCVLSTFRVSGLFRCFLYQLGLMDKRNTVSFDFCSSATQPLPLIVEFVLPRVACWQSAGDCLPSLTQKVWFFLSNPCRSPAFQIGFTACDPTC